MAKKPKPDICVQCRRKPVVKDDFLCEECRKEYDHRTRICGGENIIPHGYWDQ